VSVLVQEPGRYSASVFGTCNSGGELTFTVDDYVKGGGQLNVRSVPALGFGLLNHVVASTRPW
jgi:hypothetical protein